MPAGGTSFDTLEAVGRLQAAGVERAQAEAIAATVRAAAESGRGDLATRADLARLELRLVRWMLVVGGVIVAAVKLIP